MKAVIAVDPGSEKTGIAIVTEEGGAVAIAITPSSQVKESLTNWMECYGKDFDMESLVCGDGTHHKEFLPLLHELGETWDVPVNVVDESFSTRDGRLLYFEMNPLKGIKKWLPPSFFSPPGPVDDYTAWVIGKRYWQAKHNNG